MPTEPQTNVLQEQHHSNEESWWDTLKKQIKSHGVWYFFLFIAFVGSVGVLIQNVFPTQQTIFAQVPYPFDWMLGIVIGGVFSFLVNYAVNYALLHDLYKRLEKSGEEESKKKSSSTKKGWGYYLGIAFYVITGLMYGTIAFAFAEGSYALLCICSGILVSIVMIITELEVWLQYCEEEQSEITFWESIKNWWHELNWKKFIGFIISLGTTFAISISFAYGITVFMVQEGIFSQTATGYMYALIISSSLAFTIGAFTSYYFYNHYLPDLIDNFYTKWEEFSKTKHKWWGYTAVFLNATINGVLTYYGTREFCSILVKAGLSLSPGGILALEIVTTAFTWLSSFLLCSSFWIDKFKQTVDKVKSSLNDAPPSDLTAAANSKNRIPTALATTAEHAETASAAIANSNTENTVPPEIPQPLSTPPANGESPKL